MSLNQHYRELVYRGSAAHKPAQIFEHMMLMALGRYVQGPAVRIGASRRSPVPAAFSAAVRYIAGLMHEEHDAGRITVQIGGDDGLDLVAWRPHVDNAPGQLMLFVQCAIGTDWEGKRGELNLNLWNEHIRWHTRPVRGFAVPFVHESGRPWRETCVIAGILFDRPRIVSLLPDPQVPRTLDEKFLRGAGHE